MEDPILGIKNITAVFPGKPDDIQALADISFEVRREEFLCILGVSGSGKSTLLRLLAGLANPTRGEIHFKGKVVTKPQSGMGLVFQNTALMPWRTVEQNIRLPLELKGIEKNIQTEMIQQMIELVGLTGFELSYPIELSGGMAQRVAIARTLISDPEVLLLDEPFGALDAITRELMADELLRIWNAKKKTVVMVTHDVGEAVFLSDRVIVLSSRPGSIELDLSIELPRPRHKNFRYSKEFFDLLKQIRGVISSSLDKQNTPER